MLEFTKELLHKQCKSQILQTFEQRLSTIPQYHGLKIIKNISNMTRMTADELRNIMKIIIFALDNLYEGYCKSGISNKWLSQVYYKFLQMYIASHEESFTYDSCNHLQV